MIVEVSESNFEKEVLKARIPVAVDFWASWCAPCRLFTPIITEVSNEYSSRVKFCSLSTEENENIAAKYNILSIPTVLLFENGEVTAMSVGALPKAAFKKWLESNL